MSITVPLIADRAASVRELFGIDSNMSVPVLAGEHEHVPAIDSAYRFNPDVTLALLAGFVHNRRVLVQSPQPTLQLEHMSKHRHA